MSIEHVYVVCRTQVSPKLYFELCRRGFKTDKIHEIQCTDYVHGRIMALLDAERQQLPLIIVIDENFAFVDDGTFKSVRTYLDRCMMSFMEKMDVALLTDQEWTGFIVRNCMYRTICGQLSCEPKGLYTFHPVVGENVGPSDSKYRMNGRPDFALRPSVLNPHEE